MKPTTVLTLTLGSWIAIVHFLALFFELYWRYWWLDTVVHIFGGIFLVCLVRTVVNYGWLPNLYSVPPRLNYFLALVIIGWEVFGVILNGGLKVGFWGDTSLDILFGILGSVIGYKLLKQLMKFES